MKSFRHELTSSGDYRVVIGEDHHTETVVTVPVVREALLIIRALYKTGMGYEITPAGTILHLSEDTTPFTDHSLAMKKMATAARAHVNTHIIRPTKKEA